ncbi:MAG: sulfatase-like hydrolase/transferase [Pseudomonadota bacterium]
MVRLLSLLVAFTLVGLAGCTQDEKTALRNEVARELIARRSDLTVADPQGQITRGSVTGQATAKGYDHPDQYLAEFATKIAQNMEPVMIHEGEIAQTAQKLAALEKKTGRKPNIMIFLMDDVGWMDPGFNGGGIALGNATPTMNELAHGGLVLTSAYSTPSCTPTRATIHTGQNPLHHGLLRPPMYGEAGGLDGTMTFPKVLQKQGYITQGVGKWHMGENEGSLPQNVGYDDYYGFLGVSDMYTEWRDQYYNREVALSPKRYALLEIMPFDHYNTHCTSDDKKKCKDEYQINLTTITELDQDWAAYSENFIQEMEGNDKPFFLYHATRGCHFDNYPNDEYAGKSHARTVFSDCMVEVDDILKRLVNALKETNQLENTLIFLTSDNGPECEIPPHGRTPFRGCKGSSWEGGVRVPTFAYWPGMIKPGRSDGLFDLADLFHTAISLTGIKGADIGGLVSSDHYLDGVDQLSFLLGDNHLSNRYSRIYTMNQFPSAVRIDEFKGSSVVELEQGIFQRGYTGGFSGAVVPNTGGVVVTNLYTNPQEDTSIGIRHIPMGVLLGAEAKRYNEVLEKFPIDIKVGFQ